MRPFARPALIVAVVAALAVVLSACTVFKPGSFKVTQPGDFGQLHYALGLCTIGETPESVPCEANSREGEAQVMLVLAVPKGATAPATVTAVPGPGAPQITYNRNQEVADRFAEFIELPPELGPWPPDGSELVGYLSDVFAEKAGPSLEWTIDAPVGLPSPADGSPFGGPVNAAVATGWRLVDGTRPADRPINCDEGEAPFEPTTECEFNEKLQAGVSDLEIQTRPPVTANAGAAAYIEFMLDFASSSPTHPIFSFSGSTTVPKGTVTVDGGPYGPGAPFEGTTRQSQLRTAIVAIPANAKPGAYTVTVTAKAGGGSVSQSFQLNVVKPKIGLGKLTLNKKKGTATLQVKVFERGTLNVSGKRIVKAKQEAAKAKTLKVTIRAKGRARKALNGNGKAKVKAKLDFVLFNGGVATKTRSIVLEKTL